LFYYFDSKDLYLLKQHIPIKYFRLYFIGGFIFLIDVIFVVCYTIFNQSIQTHIGLTNTFVVCMVISIFISLISVIVYRYSKYKMDRIIFLRKRGQNTNPDKQSSNIPEKRSVSTDETLASSGLINHVDKE
jgi:hypothetical protein